MKDRYQEAAVAARTIRNFLNGSGDDHDWDDFNYVTFDNVEVEAVRLRALAIELPVGKNGHAALVTLAVEAEGLAAANGS